MRDSNVIVASGTTIHLVRPGAGTVSGVGGLEGEHPTCLAVDRGTPGRVWCGTVKGGVFRSEDGGETWSPSGLAEAHVTSLAASPTEPGVVWAGTEPSAVWRASESGAEWVRAGDLLALPSSSEWSFPPKPDTHHVRWIACHPATPGRLWAAIEAGALISTEDGGASWKDRVPDGPWDTHELAIHPERPETLRSAAGDGFFESDDGGRHWTMPGEGLEVHYFRSVAIDSGNPDVVVASASSQPRSAYVAGRSDGRLYRREGKGRWERVTSGWPDPPTTIAPLVRAGRVPGGFWAADERGVHRSGDGGRSWERVAAFPAGVDALRGMVALAAF